MSQFNTSGFGEVFAESRKSKSKVDGKPAWTQEVRDLVEQSLRNGDLQPGQIVLASEVLVVLQRNGLASHMKSANAIGDAMNRLGFAAKVKMKGKPAKWIVPTLDSMPVWNGEKWVAPALTVQS